MSLSLEKQLSQLEKNISKHRLFYSFLKKCKVRYQKTKYRLFKFTGKEKEAIYNRKFFDRNLEWNIPVAAKMVDILIKYFNPRSVVDLGCGNAEFLWQFQKRDIEIKGYEGSHCAIEKSLIDGKFIELIDLGSTIISSKRYDLALCLEVAEHIEKDFSERLIENLATLSDTVVFTAAPPGQGGHFHINEQPKEFWVSLWRNNGYQYMGELSEKIKEDFRINKVLWWYCNNLMVFNK